MRLSFVLLICVAVTVYAGGCNWQTVYGIGSCRCCQPIDGRPVNAPGPCKYFGFGTFLRHRCIPPMSMDPEAGVIPSEPTTPVICDVDEAPCNDLDCPVPGNPSVQCQIRVCSNQAITCTPIGVRCCLNGELFVIPVPQGEDPLEVCANNGGTPAGDSDVCPI